MYLKLALDNQISKVTVERLSSHYEIILMAGDRPDEEWVEDAYFEGANVFISPDLDIPNLLEKIAPPEVPVFWIDIPQGLKSDKQYYNILNQLRKLEKTLNKEAYAKA